MELKKELNGENATLYISGWFHTQTAPELKTCLDKVITIK